MIKKLFQRFSTVRKAHRFERELPFALRTAAALLNARVPFEKVLATLAKSGGAVGTEFYRITLSIAQGSPVQTALHELSKNVSSVYASRAAGELSFSYRQGANAEGLRRLADELTLVQRASAKSAASKQSLLGLAFITISCIVPALFAAYASIGSSFLESSLSPEAAFATLAIAFPMLDGALLAALALLKDW